MLKNVLCALLLASAASVIAADKPASWFERLFGLNQILEGSKITKVDEQGKKESSEEATVRLHNTARPEEAALYHELCMFNHLRPAGRNFDFGNQEGERLVHAFHEVRRCADANNNPYHGDKVLAQHDKCGKEIRQLATVWRWYKESHQASVNRIDAWVEKNKHSFE